jgi:hypothetical protein
MQEENEQKHEGYQYKETFWKGQQPFCMKCGEHLNDCLCNGDRFDE